LDVHAKADVRVVTDTVTYVKESKDNVRNFGSNVSSASTRVNRAANDLTDAAVKDVGRDEGVLANGGLLGDYQNKTNLREASLEFSAANQASAAILKNPDQYTPEEVGAAQQKFNEYASTQFGVTGLKGTSQFDGDELAKNARTDQAIADGQVIKKSATKGFYDKSNKTININARAQDGSTQDLVTTDGHELKHFIDQQQRKTTTEAGAERFGNQAAGAFQDELGGGAGVNFEGHQLWVNSSSVLAGFSGENSAAANATEIDPDREKLADGVYYYKQQIPGKPDQYREGFTTSKNGFYIDPAPMGLTANQMITFNNDDPRGKTTDQKVDLKLAEAIEGAVRKTGFTINVNSTSGGIHGEKSAHYSSPVQAADINTINGVRVDNDQTNKPAILQSEFSKNPKITENFGPTRYEIKIGNNPKTIPIPPIPGHGNHIHEGVKQK